MRASGKDFRINEANSDNMCLSLGFISEIVFFRERVFAFGRFAGFDMAVAAMFSPPFTLHFAVLVR